MITREAFRFFRAHAGGWVGHNAESALHLARAEAYAARHGWSVTWEYDSDGDLGDHAVWCAADRRQEAKAHGAPVVLELPCSHTFEGAILRDRDGANLGSLWSIIDADTAYRRVVAAELASEALGEIFARRRKQRETRAFVAAHFAL